MAQFITKVGNDYYIDLSGNRYTTARTQRENYYFFRFNTTNKHFYNIAGEDLGPTVSYAILDSKAMIWSSSLEGCELGQVFFFPDGTLSIINYEWTASFFKYFSMEWNGTTWSNQCDICTASRTKWTHAVAFKAGTASERTIALLDPADEQKNISAWEYNWISHTWSSLGNFMDSSSLKNPAGYYRSLLQQPTTTPIWMFDEYGPPSVTYYVGAVDIHGTWSIVTGGMNLSTDRGINVNQGGDNCILGRDRDSFYALDCESGEIIRTGTYVEASLSAWQALPRGFGTIIDKTPTTGPITNKYVDGVLTSST
jgi:hypothetical protein